MSTVIFNFARNFKISRFTIDVLMQRLTHLKPARHRTPEECDRFVGRAREIVTACDQLHDQLRDQFFRTQAFDVGAIASLSAGIDELHRKITESIASVNSFEYGSAPQIHGLPSPRAKGRADRASYARLGAGARDAAARGDLAARGGTMTSVAAGIARRRGTG